MTDVLKLSAPATGGFWEIPILFEDEHLLALDKPAGLLAAPEGDDATQPNLMRLLHIAIAEGRPWARDHGWSYLACAQRLDCEASGVLLLAKHPAAHTALANLFGADKPVRHCLALVQGVPREAKFEVAAPVAAHPARPGLMRVDERRGKQARTSFELVEAFAGYALLRCRPHTSRRHQIRVHLRKLRLPLAGDRLYGGAPLLLSRLKRGYRLKPGHEERPLFDSAALHAESLAFTHPATGEPVTITAPWPKDFAVAVKYLRRYAPAPLSGQGPPTVTPA